MNIITNDYINFCSEKNYIIPQYKSDTDTVTL